MWIANTAGSARTVTGAVVLMAMLLVACEKQPGANDAALVSEVQTSEWLASGCQRAEDCASVVVKREVFADRPALNAAIHAQLLEQLQGNGESPAAGSGESIEQVAEEFLEEASKVAEMSTARWQLSGEASKLARQGRTLTVVVRSYLYSGGAHGMPVTHWLNWDLAAEKALVLADVLQPGKEQAFWQLAEGAHRSWLASQNLGEDFSDNWPFAHGDDFRLTDKGITLLYGVYTIAPYSMGEIELTVPWDRLGDVVRAEYMPTASRQ